MKKKPAKVDSKKRKPVDVGDVALRQAEAFAQDKKILAMLKITPENRRRTGGKLKNGLDPSIGEKTQFKPGVSPNPGGRPKDTLSDAQKDWLKRIDPVSGKTNAERVVEAQGNVALAGDTASYCAIRDTAEGRPSQKVTIDGSNTTDPTQRAREIIAAGLERLAGRSSSL